MNVRQYERLPDCFKTIIMLDREMAESRVVEIEIARTRRQTRRLCEIFIANARGQ